MRLLMLSLALLLPACKPSTGKVSTVQPPITQPPKPAIPEPPIKTVTKAPELPSFDDKDMTRRVNLFREYPIDDYKKLPYCLDVLKECVAVPFEGKTGEQYKAAVTAAARKPCRIILKLVDISADYDYAKVELLKEDGSSARDQLKEAGDLGNYNRHFKEPFAINQAKKKGLDTKLSVGDKIVLVGLGDVVNASHWGAASPSHGMPRGDERYVMLRAFGKPNSYHPHSYEFSFMIRNWYIASQ